MQTHILFYALKNGILPKDTKYVLNYIYGPVKITGLSC